MNILQRNISTNTFSPSKKDLLILVIHVNTDDPKIPITKRVNHRDYLTKVSVFKEVYSRFETSFSFNH